MSINFLSMTGRLRPRSLRIAQRPVASRASPSSMAAGSPTASQLRQPHEDGSDATGSSRCCDSEVRNGSRNGNHSPNPVFGESAIVGDAGESPEAVAFSTGVALGPSTRLDGQRTGSQRGHGLKASSETAAITSRIDTVASEPAAGLQRRIAR